MRVLVPYMGFLAWTTRLALAFWEIRRTRTIFYPIHSTERETWQTIEEQEAATESRVVKENG